MKRSVLTITIVFLLLSIVNVRTTYAHVIEDGMVEVTTVSTDVMIPQGMTSSSARINYELPFPGMLPDNPFYFLKVLRDRIVKTLINDSFQEAKFNLLTAQKRMYAGKLLIDKKKYNLGFDTIEKSNNYLLDALNAIKKEMKDNPKSTDIRPFLDQFRTVTLKHEEVLMNIEETAGKKYQENVHWQEERVENIRENVEKLLLQK